MRLEELHVERGHQPGEYIVAHTTTDGQHYEAGWGFFQKGSAEYHAWTTAIRICARKGKPILVAGPTGAFEIRPARYPQAQREKEGKQP